MNICLSIRFLWFSLVLCLIFVLLIVYSISVSSQSFVRFHPSLSWLPSLEYKWQQHCIVLQNSPQYSSWSQQYCGLDSFNYFTDLQFFQFWAMREVLGYSGRRTTVFFSFDVLSKYNNTMVPHSPICWWGEHYLCSVSYAGITKHSPSLSRCTIDLNCFPSPRPVALPMLKSPIYPTKRPQMKKDQVDPYIFQMHLRYGKCKRSFPQIWSRDTESTSFDDNRYPTCLSHILNSCQHI